MRFFGKLLSMATFIYCHQCIKYLDIQNQALYNEIVDHFFPKELGHPGIDIVAICTNIHLTGSVADVQKRADIMVRAALMLFSIIISHLLKSTLIFFSI